jgi:hypothetical protein
MAQKYGNVPADRKVTLNWPPGAIAPEFQTPVFDVDVCVTESVFVHVTLPPTATLMGLGE